MNKSKVNYFIDLGALISFLITAITGLAIFFFIPNGVRQGRFQEFLGIEKGTWTAVYNWVGIIFIILVIIHFILHWNWIVCMTKNIFKPEKCETNNK